MKRKKILIYCFSIVFAAPFLLVLYGGIIGLENYCFFYPGIDTRYAPHYSESAFNQVKTGMIFQTVKQLAGTPLYSVTNHSGTTVWRYTGDGKCMGFADFAWLGREVHFRDGEVIEVVKCIYYN